MPAKESRINLLPQEEFAASTFGRILAWALSSFRVIVIITEMIVIVAFLSRFWLDAQASDLNDAIKQKKAIILSLTDLEKKFKDAQKRLKIFSGMTIPEKPVTSLLSKITSALPSDVLLTNISLGSDSISVKGVSSSERSISQFIVNLKSSGNFTDVSLSSVSTNTEDKTLLDFNIKLTYGKGGSPAGGA